MILKKDSPNYRIAPEFSYKPTHVKENFIEQML